jgi:antitoxin MazE
MSAAVARWGNSLAIRLPRGIAEDAHLSEGTPVMFTTEDGRLIVESTRPRYELADLLAKMQPDHPRSEFDWGTPLGQEVW